MAAAISYPAERPVSSCSGPASGYTSPHPSVVPSCASVDFDFPRRAAGSATTAQTPDGDFCLARSNWWTAPHLNLRSEVPGGAPLRYRHMPAARQGLDAKEQVAGALPPVLVVLPLGLPRLRRYRRPGVGQQLGGGLAESLHWPPGILGFGIKVRDIRHGPHEVGADRSRRPPEEYATVSSATAWLCFSSAAAPSRTTGTQPLPDPPSVPPTGAGSSVRGLREPVCRPRR